MVATLVLCIVIWLTPLWAYAQTPQTTLDRTAPLAKGLTAWFKAIPKFNGGKYMYDIMGGPPIQLTNMGNAGTTSGWAGPTQTFHTGEIRFDGVDDNMSTPANSAIMPPFYSMLLWMKMAANAPGDYALLWEAVNGNASLYITNNNQIAAYAGAISLDPATTVLSINTWYHIAVVSTTQVRAYVNCRLDGTAAGAGPLSASAFSHLFGMNSSTGSKFTGSMNDMRFYNRSLTGEEVCAAMQESKRGDPQLLPTLYSGKGGNVLGFVLATFTKGRFFPFFRAQ
jgi:hypothetical protein